MIRLGRWLSPFLILGLCIGIGVWLVKNKPKAKRGAKSTNSQLTVEATKLRLRNYQVRIYSYGTVTPRTQNTLIPEVSGKIIKVSPNFREGGFFEKGETLLQIDPRDYQAEVKIAQSVFIQARLSLEEEKTRSAQAQRDWTRYWNQSGNGGNPNDLDLSKLRLSAARAVADSAKIKLELARLNLARTELKAPFVGRILTKNVDIGQYVAKGNALAEFYAIDYVEVRLPLNNRQLEFLEIPEQYRGDSGKPRQMGPEVTIFVEVGKKQFQWKGEIVRTEGAIDTKSQQLFVVAQIQDPYGKKEKNKPPLKIGQFVKAEILGQLLKDVIVIPRASLYQSRQVMLVKEEKLSRKEVVVLWSDSREAVIKEGLKAGDVLSLTVIGSIPSGTSVSAIIDGKPPLKKEKKNTSIVKDATPKKPKKVPSN